MFTMTTCTCSQGHNNNVQRQFELHVSVSDMLIVSPTIIMVYQVKDALGKFVQHSSLYLEQLLRLFHALQTSRMHPQLNICTLSMSQFFIMKQPFTPNLCKDFSKFFSSIINCSRNTSFLPFHITWEQSTMESFQPNQELYPSKFVVCTQL